MMRYQYFSKVVSIKISFMLLHYTDLFGSQERVSRQDNKRKERNLSLQSFCFYYSNKRNQHQ